MSYEKVKQLGAIPREVLGSEGNRLEHLPDCCVDHRVEELVFVTEVDIDHSLVCVCSGSDAVYPCTGETVIGKLNNGRGKDARLCCFGVSHCHMARVTIENVRFLGWNPVLHDITNWLLT